MAILETINRYLSQSGADWMSLSQAMDYNPVVIGMFLTGCIVLCLSFLIVTTLSAKSLLKQGFFSPEHKRLVIWFLLFLLLCGISFGVQAVLVFYQFYWIYSGLLCITGVAAGLTAILYLTQFKELSKMPTPKQIMELQGENDLLRKQTSLLNEHLEVWSQNVGFHITMLKNEYVNLSQEVRSSTPNEPIEKDNEIRVKVLETLTKIKEELTSLTESIK